MEILLTILIVCITSFVIAQSDTLQSKPAAPKTPVKLDLLLNYYEQEGEHSAVNGGVGSQGINLIAPQFVLNVPLKDSSDVGLTVGVDHYTSASLLDIDKYRTTASSGTSDVAHDETRTHFDLSYGIGDRKHNMKHKLQVGASTEYDVKSWKFGYEISKRNPSKNRLISSNLLFTHDKWFLIYPGEFRSEIDYAYYNGGTGSSGGGYGSGSGSTGGGSTGTGSGETGSGGSGSGSGSGSGMGILKPNDEYKGGMIAKSGASPVETEPNAGSIGGTIPSNAYPTADRNTITWETTLNQVITRKSQFAVTFSLTRQWGNLSTPFNRVYFNDGVADQMYKEVRIETLPGERWRFAAGGKYSYYIHKNVILKTGIRLYADNWGIASAAFNTDVALKLVKGFTLIPGYRISFQQGSDYFAGYSTLAVNSQRYYTSDFDLSSFAFNRFSMGIRYSPLNKVFHRQNPKGHGVSLPAIEVKYSYFRRTDGLTANNLTLGLSFDFF